MNVTHEELMAYADGELSGADAARVEAAIAADPALGERLAAERRLRTALQGHLNPIAEAPVPDALTAMIAAAAQEDDHKVVSLAAARADREARADSVAPRSSLQRWGSGLAIAASLVLGLMLGTQIQPRGPIREKNGALIASGSLAKGLDTQLASTQGEGGALRILTSFQRQGGDYCRVFEAGATSGIACRDNANWVLERTMASGTEQTSEYRQAGSNDAALMAAAQDMAAGPPLDAAQEKTAKAKGWVK